MILILQAVLIMLATVVTTLVESTDLPPVPEDSEHLVILEGSEPLPNREARHYYTTHQLPHHRAVSTNPGNWHGHGHHATTTERYCAPTTVTRTINISPTVVPEVPEVPELPEDYCNGPGQFLFGATNECFLHLSDGLRTFEDADAECRKGGMRLAKPKKPKAIQKHLVTVLGQSGHVWLGARGDGQSFVWQTNDGASIMNTDPLWWNGMPAFYITNDRCLVLVAYPNAVKKEKVFYPEMCSSKRTALCQRSQCSPECYLGTCTGPNACVYDPRSAAVCPSGCGNGNCTGPNECTCSVGYTGITCNKAPVEMDVSQANIGQSICWSSSYTAKKAFLPETSFYVSNAAPPQTIWARFAVPVQVVKYSFQSRSDSHMVNQGPTKYVFFGSNSTDCSDKSAWTHLVEDNSGTPFTTANIPKTELVPGNRSFNCYGFYVTATSLNRYVGMDNIKLYTTDK